MEQKTSICTVQLTFQFTYCIRDQELCSLGLDERDFLFGISVHTQTCVRTLK